MRIIADESVDGRIIGRLRLAGHDVLAIAESAAGTPDDLVLANADTAGVLLLTADKDFGELVFRRRIAAGSPRAFLRDGSAWSIEVTIRFPRAGAWGFLETPAPASSRRGVARVGAAGVAEGHEGVEDFLDPKLPASIDHPQEGHAASSDFLRRPQRLAPRRRRHATVTTPRRR